MSNFTIYTDKTTDFDFKVEVDGASLKEAVARLILSGDKANFIIEGKINSDGSAFIQIPKMKGLVEEDYSGDMKLEIIVDEAYFEPWNGKYNVSKSKKVVVNEVSVTKEPDKPKMSVTVKENKSLYQKKIDLIVEFLHKKNISSRNILTNRNKKYLYSLMENTFEKPIKNLNTSVIIRDVVNNM